MARWMFIALLFIVTTGSVDAPYDAIVVRNDLPFEWIIAQAYSHKSGTPIVTTNPYFLGDDSRDQLDGYLDAGAVRVLVMGGERAVSPAVLDELVSMGFLTHRISEADRYGTSARVAVELYPDSKSCIMVNGDSNSGLLVAERAAAMTDAPILLIQSDEVPGSVMDAMTALGVRDVYLVTQGLSGDIEGSLTASGYRVIALTDRADIPSGTGFPYGILYGIAGVILGILGYAGFMALKRTRERVPYSVLTEDEEKIVKAIRAAGGEMTQDKLPELTDFSRPKISRIIADLAGREVLTKEPHGRTQKLKIETEFYEKH